MNEKSDYQNEYFKIGVVVKSHGVKGEIKVFPTTDEPERFIGLDFVELYLDYSLGEYKIEYAKVSTPFVIIKFREVSDREAADKLRGVEVRIPSHKGLPLSDDEYYVRDLIGMEVYDTVCGLIGIVENVIPTGANDVYSVRAGNGQEVLIPAIKQCILGVDIKSRRIDVELMEGMRGGLEQTVK